MRRVLKRNLGRRVANLGSAVQEVATFRRRKRNDLREKTVSSAGKSSESNVSVRVFGRSDMIASGRGSAWRGRDYPSLIPLTFFAQVYTNLFDDEGDEIIPRVWRS